MPPFVLRPTHAWIASAALALSASLLSPATTRAQAQPNQPSLQADTFQRMARISAVTVCRLLNQKVPFDVSMLATSEALAGYIVQVHGGKIETQPDNLTPQQVLVGVSNTIALGAYEVCKNSLPADVAKDIEENLKASRGATAPSRK